MYFLLFHGNHSWPSEVIELEQADQMASCFRSRLKSQKKTLPRFNYMNLNTQPSTQLPPQPKKTTELRQTSNPSSTSASWSESIAHTHEDWRVLLGTTVRPAHERGPPKTIPGGSRTSGSLSCTTLDVQLPTETVLNEKKVMQYKENPNSPLYCIMQYCNWGRYWTTLGYPTAWSLTTTPVYTLLPM